MRRPGRNRRNAGSQQPLIWPPSNVSGLVAWHDMLETYTESAGAVTGIMNEASQTDWTEATNPPALTTINGRPAMQGDGTDDRIISTEAAVAAAFTGDDPAWTLIAVVEPTVTSTALKAFFAAANSAGTPGYTVFRHFESSGTERWNVLMVDDASASANITRATTFPVQLRPQVLSVVCTGATATMWVNDDPSPIASNVSAIGTRTPNRCGFFCKPDNAPDSFGSDKVGAQVIYSRAVSTYERLGLVRAMRNRWGI